LWEKQHRETGSDLLFHVKADWFLVSEAADCIVQPN
jgi:hypothetical protein